MGALQVFKLPGQLSHQIALENVFLCNKGLYVPYLLQIMASSKDEGNLYVHMKNVHSQRHHRNYGFVNPVYFAYIRNITMTGTNFFNASNVGQ